MTLEIRLRRFSFLPGFLQTGNGEPRKAHIVGGKAPTALGKQDPGHKNPRPSPEKDSDKFRPLDTISLGEVRLAYTHYQHQLVPSPTEGWIAQNYFCQLPIRQHTGHEVPVVFGRVSASFPGDGHVQNLKQIEVHFPNADREPDLLKIRRSDIQLDDPVYSYCVGVKMYLSPSEMDDFRRSENIFIEKGFAPLYETGSLDLLDIHEQQQESLLWLNVIGSEWFASIPPSLQPEVRERLRDMAEWGKLILNYHPRRHSLRYLSLNEELEFNYGFTKHFLLTPQDTGQALQKVDELFEQIFMQPMH